MGGAFFSYLDQINELISMKAEILVIDKRKS